MVTGSHIPFDRNGIKFTRPSGEVMKADEQHILAAVAAARRAEYEKPFEQSLFDAQRHAPPGAPRGIPAPGSRRGGRIRPADTSPPSRAARWPGRKCWSGSTPPWAGSCWRGRYGARRRGGRRGAERHLRSRGHRGGERDHAPVSAGHGGRPGRDSAFRRRLHGRRRGPSPRSWQSTPDGRVSSRETSWGCWRPGFLGRAARGGSRQLQRRGGRVLPCRGIELVKTRIGSPHVIAALREAGWEGNGGFLTAARPRRSGRRFPFPAAHEGCPAADPLRPVIAHAE